MSRAPWGRRADVVPPRNLAHDARPPAPVDDGEPGIGVRARGLLLAFPVALVVDLLAVIVLERVLGAGRGLSIALAMLITILAWAGTGRLVQSRGRGGGR